MQQVSNGKLDLVCTLCGQNIPSTFKNNQENRKKNENSATPTVFDQIDFDFFVITPTSRLEMFTKYLYQTSQDRWFNFQNTSI